MSRTNQGIAFKCVKCGKIEDYSGSKVKHTLCYSCRISMFHEIRDNRKDQQFDIFKDFVRNSNSPLCNFVLDLQGYYAMRAGTAEGLYKQQDEEMLARLKKLYQRIVAVDDEESIEDEIARLTAQPV